MSDFYLMVFLKSRTNSSIDEDCTHDNHPATSGNPVFAIGNTLQNIVNILFIAQD